MKKDGIASASEGELSVSATWTIENDKSYLAITTFGITDNLECVYKVDGDTLTLTESEGNVSMYHKIK